MRRFAGTLVVMAAFAAGCETDEGVKPAADGAVTGEQPASPQVAGPVEPKPTVVEPAKPGMSSKVKYDQSSPAVIVTTPLAEYVRIKDRLVLQNIEYALKLYNAEHGEYPQSHDEFMEKIVKFNNIKLPKLPDGHEYWYDAETHTLMIKHPAE